MKKGVKILLTVLNFVAVIALFLYGIAFIFVGLFGEALVAVFTLGYGSADGSIVAMFTGPALMLMAVSLLVLIATVLFIVTFKKPLKGLQIAMAGIFSLAALLVLIAILVLFINIGFEAGNVSAFLVVGLVALLHVALFVLTAVFGGFIPAFKKQAAVEEIETAEEVK